MLFTKLKIKNLVRHKFVHHQKPDICAPPYTKHEFTEYFELKIFRFVIEITCHQKPHFESLFSS